MHTNVKNCQKERLNVGMMLLHDSKRPHIVGLTQSMLIKLKFKVVTHPYGPDLSPCDYEVFGLLKKFLEGKCFSTDKEVKKVVTE